MIRDLQSGKLKIFGSTELTVYRADTFFARLFGLLGSPRLEAHEGLVLDRASSIHTCFLRYPIDVLFCNADYYILALKSDLRPWRFSRYIKNTSIIIELPAGTISKLQITAGIRLAIKWDVTS
ncbi:DUF192 domain-containing protein [bacterium]|nr:DUF192 domain-containing protein [bacterium]